MSPNRLVQETSPYLRQHANNPVDWYPWGEEALAKAKKEDKPILLSIGYSACHWCHVMEKESFENLETARIMNRNFVNIKVDREERPDLDAIYMEAVQALTGQGGWPLTVFLTPDRKPFFGGTYFPPIDRGGLPSFSRVLREIAEIFREKRREVEKNAQSIFDSLDKKLDSSTREVFDHSILENVFLQFTYSYDRVNGGFGRAPKFPQPSILELLLWMGTQQNLNYAIHMVDHTLTKMAQGGIYDHLGGGFHRYSVDSKWIVPHFEKMLYDNAQLSLIYLHAYQITKNQLYRRVVEEILSYVIREMHHSTGGFYSTQDADSEGEEGKFYIWTKDEVETLLGKAEGEALCRFFNITEAGTFEGKNILNITSNPKSLAVSLSVPLEELAKIVDHGRHRLFEEREKRIKPAKDEKVLASWNGLMLKSFAEVAKVLHWEEYRTIAEENAKFLLENMYVDGQLMHSWKDSEARISGFLEDYAFLADGLLSLYQATFNMKWLDAAYSLANVIVAKFQDNKNGGFYDTSGAHKFLITRPKNVYDQSIPSGASVASRVLFLLSRYKDDKEMRDATERALRSIGSLLETQPTVFCSWLATLGLYLSPPTEVALVGDPESESLRHMLHIIFEPYRPSAIVALQPEGHDYSAKIPFLMNKPQIPGKATAYACRNYVCDRPVTDPKELSDILDKKSD